MMLQADDEDLAVLMPAAEPKRGAGVLKAVTKPKPDTVGEFRSAGR